MNIFYPYHYALFLWKTLKFYKRQSQYQCKLILKKIFNALALIGLVLFSTLSQAGINTGLAGDDVVTGALPIGFNFNLYGKDFSQFYASTNGLLQFSGPTTAYSNTCLPSSYANTLFVFWDDLRTNVSGQPIGTIQYETIGEAPDRQLVVQWTNQYFYSSNKPMGTFQVILYEGSNQIKFQYRNLLDANSTGNGATIGIQGFNRQVQQIGCNQANILKAEQAILYTPNSDMTSYSVDTQAEYDFIDISGLTPAFPIAGSRYTNQELSWSWSKVPTLNTYEIEIQDQLGNIVHSSVVGNVDKFTYATNLEHGKSYRARIRGSINSGATWEIWSRLSSTTTVDIGKPTVQIDSFTRTGSDTAKVTYKATDDLSGVASVQLQIATDVAFKNIVINQAISANSNMVNVESLPTTGSLYVRISAVDLVGNQSGFSTVQSTVLLPPVIVKPVTNATAKQAKVEVMGTADTAGNVQLYLNGTAHGSRIAINAENNFTTEITLPAEGAYKLNADIQNSFGTSERSSEINFAYKLPEPKASFVTPAQDLTLSATTNVEVSAIDDLGIKTVEIYIDDTKQATLTEAPYQYAWDVTSIKNGNHTIKAIITNTSGKTATLTRAVVVNVVAPEPPPTIYTGEITSISPTTSYGPQPITFTGNALYRADATKAPNIPLVLVLSVNGFDKKVKVVTDETGAFSYTYQPQPNDAGIYTIAAIHPNEKNGYSQGSFAINRIKFELAGFNLGALRNIPSQVNVTATTSAGATELRWVARAEDQATGTLPKGIKIDGGSGINIAAGKSAPTLINFTADNTANETGSIFLVAFAKDSGDLIRGKFQINYRLGEAQPNLKATPTLIETGVQQGRNITESFKLSNHGLVAAQDVQIKLLDAQNKAAPSWVFISASNLGVIDAAEEVELQLTVQPESNISDGIYRFNILVTATNGNAGTIPVAVSVTQSGKGSVRFDVADIFTATLDKQGQPILGVNKATIKLQNDNVLTEQYQVKTNDQGIAEVNDIPPGIYRYRISATDHIDTSGRVIIRPSVTTNQHIFLEYQLISIDFNVTETTIEDVYDIELEATFNTQVPAPVVVFEPLSVNLGELEEGEVKTGELVLSNYGLVQADNLTFNPPKSDARFKYEFLAEIPTTLAPKTRLVIPYRVTSLPSTVRALRSAGGDSDCSSYYANYSAQYNSECVNGDTSNGSSDGNFYKLKGKKCGGSGISWNDSGSWGGWSSVSNSGGWNSSSSSSPAPMSMTPNCDPDSNCEECCEPPPGAGSGNE